MSTRSRIIFYLLFFLCIIVTGEYLLPIAIGAMFAYLSEHPFDLFCKKFKIKKNSQRWISASCLVCVAVILVLVPIIYGIISGVLQISEMIVANRADIAARIPNLQSGEIDGWLKRFRFPFQFSEIASRITQAIGSGAQQVAAAVGSAIQGTPEALLKIFLAGLAWIVFLMDGKKYRDNMLPLLIPWQPERDIICQTTADVLRGVVVASALVSLVQGVIVTLFLLISGTPNTFLLGVMSFFASFVPVIGTMPILLGSALFHYIDGSVGWAIFLALSIFVVGSVDNLLRPYFFKGSVDLSFFWITTAFLGGLATAGLAGAVIGPLLFSLFYVFYNRTFQRQDQNQTNKG